LVLYEVDPGETIAAYKPEGSISIPKLLSGI